MLEAQAVRNAPGQVFLDGEPTPPNIRLLRKWSGGTCRAQLVNEGGRAVAVRQVTLFSLHHALPSKTALYGEGFQMLSQTGGTLAQPVNIGHYTDDDHYKLISPEGAHSVYGVLVLAPPLSETIVLGFASCRRFSGRFDIYAGRIDIVLDTEGLELAAGETWELEDVVFLKGPEQAVLLNTLTKRIAVNHPPLRFKSPPTGWCSWYGFGPEVTGEQILANLAMMAEKLPGLHYVQIDDGYQSAMGDWLTSGKAFDGGVQKVLQAIREKGRQPALWVAPFIAEEDSDVFREHPDWFVQGTDDKPLPSDRVTFGGWRNGPWYALDGTHPDVQKHLETVFRTMNKDWGCTYFKLDANFWGALHGGRFYDRKATRIEAYRRGMEAILRGAGKSFILGCNHPLWPSLGLIHGSRSSNDISRNWQAISGTARENLSRNWQNENLWWNDPDCLLLTGDLPENEFVFHATVLLATGGMILSGDDLTQIPAERLAMLQKMLPPTGAAATFSDNAFNVGVIERSGFRLLCLFNWGEQPQSITVRLSGPSHFRDFWRDEDLGEHDKSLTIADMPPHSARLLICTP